MGSGPQDYKNAEREYKKTLTFIPENDSRRIYVYERQGQIALKRKSISKAKNFFLAGVQTARKLSVSDVNVVNAYLGLAYCFEKSANTPAAIKNYEKALELAASGKTKTRIRKILQKLKAQPQ